MGAGASVDDERDLRAEYAKVKPKLSPNEVSELESTFNRSKSYGEAFVISKCIEKYNEFVSCGDLPNRPSVSTKRRSHVMRARTRDDLTYATQANTSRGEFTNCVDDVQGFKLPDLRAVVENALAEGKTPLICDDSDDSKVETFYSYKGAIIIDAKRMGRDRLRDGDAIIPDILEGARRKVVAAMKNGVPLIISMRESALDIRGTMHSNNAFPHALFEKGGTNFVNENNPNKNRMAEDLFREGDLDSGMAICRRGFCVIVTSFLDPANCVDYFFRNDFGLPLSRDYYQLLENQSR